MNKMGVFYFCTMLFRFKKKKEKKKKRKKKKEKNYSCSSRNEITNKSWRNQEKQTKNKRIRKINLTKFNKN